MRHVSDSTKSNDLEFYFILYKTNFMKILIFLCSVCFHHPELQPTVQPVSSHKKKAATSKSWLSWIAPSPFKEFSVFCFFAPLQCAPLSPLVCNWCNKKRAAEKKWKRVSFILCAASRSANTTWNTSKNKNGNVEGKKYIYWIKN